MIVHTYGALEPTSGAKEADAVLQRAHRYRNVLVGIERDHRKRYREIEKSIVPEAITIAVADAEAKVVAAYKAIAAARTGIGKKADISMLAEAAKETKRSLAAARKAYKEHAEPLRRAATLVKSARNVERGVRRAARKRDRDDAAIAAALSASSDPNAPIALRLHENDARAETEKREARSRSGIAWGTYSLVEEDVARAAKDTAGDPAAPRFKDYDGEGRIGANQIVGGAAASDLATHPNLRLEMIPLPKGVYARQVRRRHAVVRIRLGEAWASWPILMHRPLPEDCSIRQAWAKRERIGSRHTWKIQLVIDDSASAKLPAATGKAVAIDLGWRTTDAYRVGYFVDSDGSHDAIRAPMASFGDAKRRRRQWAEKGVDVEPLDKALVDGKWKLPIQDALDYLDSIRAVRDKHFDVARAFVREHIDEAKAVPEDVKRQAASMHAWRGHGRLVGLLRTWEREDSGSPILDGLRAWQKKDAHLWDWEVHGRRRVLLARREHYRIVAAEMARKYDTIVFEEFDLREFAAARPAEEGVPSDERNLRKAQRYCAPSEFRAAVEHAGTKAGRTLHHEDRAGTTETCHVCSRVEAWDDPAALLHTCGGCGSTWDRDANAGVNLLRRGGWPMDRTRILASGEAMKRTA